MIKGIQGHGYYDELVVPIIENTAQESELTEALSEAVYLQTNYTSCSGFFYEFYSSVLDGKRIS